MSATSSSGLVEKRHNILFVLEYFYPSVGGVETLFTQLAVALAAHGHSVCVVTLCLPNSSSREMYRGVEIIRIPAPSWGQRFLFTLWAIPETLKRARIADIIHTTTYNAALPARLAALWSRKPCVITVHEVFAEQWNNLPSLHHLLGFGFRLLDWAILRLRFNHYVCDSEFTRKRLLRHLNVLPSKATVVYPAVDYDFWNPVRHRPRPLREELGLDPKAFLYLYFGRPGLSKGVEYLIEAAEIVRKELPSSRLVLLLSRVPDEGYRRTLAQIKNRGLSDHVVILESVPREQLPGYLLAANSIIIPSISEGFGYAAVEATTIGCRVVATSGHAVEEILSDFVDLVPPRDSVALARAVINQSLSVPQVKHAPALFDTTSHVARVIDLYERLLSVKRCAMNFHLRIWSRPE